jgi:hypothetical protein
VLPLLRVLRFTTIARGNLSLSPLNALSNLYNAL